MDLLAEGVEVPEKDPGALDLSAAWQGEVDTEETEDGQPASSAQQEEPPRPKVATEDFNPTLYSFDPREVEILRREVDRNTHKQLLDQLSSSL